MQNCSHQLILPLILVFTILQLIILAIFGYTPYPDSEGYIWLAQDSIAHQDIYPVGSELNQYPFLWNIGAINMVWLSLVCFNSITPLLVFYSVLKGITAWLFYQITKETINHQVAFIALIIYLIYPANYGESTSTLSELPFMFFSMLGIYLCLTKRFGILGGISLAIANWFRPMGIVFLLGILVYFLFSHRKKIVHPIIGYVLMICVIGGLSMKRTGLFLYQAKTGWMALMDYSSNHATESMQIRESTDWNVSQKDSAWQSLFMDWVKDHPIEYIKQMPPKLINTYLSDNVNMCAFIPDKANQEYMYEEVSMNTLIHNFPRLSPVQWLTVLNFIIYLLIIITSIIGLFYFRLDTHLLPVSIIALGTLLLLCVGHGEARFHIPFISFFIIMSAQFIHKRIWKG